MRKLSAPRTAFRARLAASQVSIPSVTDTKLALATVDFDIGGYFDAAVNYRWAPPAGPVRLSAMVNLSGLTGATAATLKIFKNGAVLASGLQVADAGGLAYPSISIVDLASGGDYYEFFVHGTTATTITAAGAVSTRCCGEQI